MDLIRFVLIAYGLTQILVYSRILGPIRPKYYFFHCPMCIGFWVGAILMALNPFTTLFTFEVSLVNGFLLGCLSSGTSYALCMLISDGGLQHEYRLKGSLDAKMDAKTSNKLLQG
jgi:hypothetical protein